MSRFHNSLPTRPPSSFSELPVVPTDSAIVQCIHQFRHLYGSHQCIRLAAFLSGFWNISDDLLLQLGLHELALLQKDPGEQQDMRNLAPQIGIEEVEMSGTVTLQPTLVNIAPAPPRENGRPAASLASPPLSSVIRKKKPKPPSRKKKDGRKRAEANKWTEEESAILRQLLASTFAKTPNRWAKMARILNEQFDGGKTGASVSQHYNRVIQSSRSPYGRCVWTLEEEALLLEHVQKNGAASWRKFSRHPDVDKTDVQARYFYDRFYRGLESIPEDELWSKAQLDTLAKRRADQSWVLIANLVRRASARTERNHSPHQCKQRWERLQQEL